MEKYLDLTKSRYSEKVLPLRYIEVPLHRIGAILHGNCRCTVAEGGSKFLQSVPKP